MRHVVLILVLAASVAGCAGSRKLALSTSPDIPAAEGTVRFDTTDNGNTKIDLVVKHLATPERVDPQALVYLVWVKGESIPAQRLGALRVDDDLEGTLTSVTPLRSFDLFITAEPSQTVVSPTGKRLLETNVVMD